MFFFPETLTSSILTTRVGTGLRTASLFFSTLGLYISSSPLRRSCPGSLLSLSATGLKLLPARLSASFLSGPALYLVLRPLSTLILFITVVLFMIVTLLELLI